MNPVSQAVRNPFTIKNIRLFIAFRVFFNSRFYYPIFTILFLDFGLSLPQFAVLNAVWAATIVLVEVPSGALADTVGRRNILIAAGFLMVLEMGLLCIAPRGYPELLFIVFFANRVISGAAEAAASGADEALAYDSLKIEGNISDWGRVLTAQMRFQSLGFVAAMSIGAAVYDPLLMQTISEWTGFGFTVTREATLRLPIFLTMGMAILALVTAFRMTEHSKKKKSGECLPEQGCIQSIRDAMTLTFDAGKWILKTPFALVVIGAGVLLDSILRMMITMASQYYRIIKLPEASFGIIGSGLALLGMIMPKIASELVRNHSFSLNMLVVFGITLFGLTGMSLSVPIIGLLPVAVLVSAIFLTGFMISHYLNRITASHQRATVLSFKGLSYNLAFGALGIMYAILFHALKVSENNSVPGMTDEEIKNAVFAGSLFYFPLYFFIATGLFMIFALWKLRHTRMHREPG